MNRRNFIKNTLLTAAAAAGAGIVGVSMTQKDESSGGKKMKIFVITGSPRMNGNSNTLVDNFTRGAEEAGHQVIRFDSAKKNVHPCIACNKCGMNGECVFKDDFEFVREHIVDADAVVFATPMYYFGMSAQIKTVIDRFYAINGQIHKPKKAILFMTYADTAQIEAEPIIKHYERLIRYLGWSDAGKVIVPGVWNAGDIKSTSFTEKAYELGKTI